MSKSIYAVIDLGSNSFHMAVMQEEQGHIVVLDRLREMVQLAYGLQPDGKLNDSVRERALNCLRKFNERITNIPPSNIRAVGTLTLRKMKDPNFIQAAENALGIPIDIISGREEARLIYLGVSQYVHVENRELFVVDIGGGSTEFILGSGDNIKYSYSKEVGCVNLTKSFFSEGLFTKAKVKEATLFVESELYSLKHLMPYHDAYFVGASGSIKTINLLSEYIGIENNTLTLESIKLLLRRVIALGSTNKIREFFNLSEERARVICAGLIILQTIYRLFSIQTLFITDVAMREGIMFDLLGRIHKSDRRDKTIFHLLDRFGADREQAERVAELSLKFAEMLNLPMINNQALHYLCWSSLLHEVGLAVSHHRHFKHSAYLIEHADLDGFSKQDQKIIATMLYNHQRKFTMDDFDLLPKFTPYITLILRLSVLFNRSRSSIDLGNFQLEMQKNAIQLRFQPGWLKKHPLIAEDLKNEELYLKRADIKLIW